jgi:hypothetical protein
MRNYKIKFSVRTSKNGASVETLSEADQRLKDTQRLLDTAAEAHRRRAAIDMALMNAAEEIASGVLRGLEDVRMRWISMAANKRRGRRGRGSAKIENQRTFSGDVNAEGVRYVIHLRAWVKRPQLYLIAGEELPGRLRIEISGRAEGDKPRLLNSDRLNLHEINVGLSRLSLCVETALRSIVKGATPKPGYSSPLPNSTIIY